VTLAPAVIVLTQSPVPAVLHASDQPTKCEPASAVAVRVTTVPASYVVAHASPQSIPPGTLVMLPEPPPAFTTANAYVGRVKVAVTDRAASIVTAHVPVPEQPPPLQPSKVEVASGAAVRVTVVPVT
jgi:hypothetical protein